MPKKQYLVHLSADERATLLGMLQSGTHKARTLMRARVLLLADDGRIDADIAERVLVVRQTVERVRQRFAEGGLERALYDRPRKGAERLLSPEDEALLVALACSPAPDGQDAWSLQLLADELVAMERVASVSKSTISRRLKTNR
jgi:transposase